MTDTGSSPTDEKWNVPAGYGRPGSHEDSEAAPKLTVDQIATALRDVGFTANIEETATGKPFCNVGKIAGNVYAHVTTVFEDTSFTLAEIVAAAVERSAQIDMTLSGMDAAGWAGNPKPEPEPVGKRWRFYCTHEAWYGPTPGMTADKVEAEIMIAGPLGEFAVRWHRLSSGLYPQIEAFSDGWYALADPRLTPLFAWLAEMHRRNVTPDQFAAKLVELGLPDTTQRTQGERR